LPLRDERGDFARRGSGNCRNGTNSKTVSKTVLTGVGAFDVEIRRDRTGQFESKLIREMASPSRRPQRADHRHGRERSTRQIQAHLEGMHQVDLSGYLISRVTNAVVDEPT
jgi:transposase-like protein